LTTGDNTINSLSPFFAGRIKHLGIPTVPGTYPIRGNREAILSDVSLRPDIIAEIAKKNATKDQTDLTKLIISKYSVTEIAMLTALKDDFPAEFEEMKAFLKPLHSEKKKAKA
jgi:hypothetical protein